ncbi:MAG: tetratricopeptide repeat protein [Xenococcaceae cyanobacterium MO_167.B52]|nr:tetratricopeptide repeat protein [Xenococcaceae cyanobacterium MO_167.B52]
MLRWIGQHFKKKSTSNSLTSNQLDQGEETLSNLDLTDGDYEFLFNQLLEGVAHGWHQVRIVKFFDQLEERGETQKWVAWLKRFYQKLPTSPNPIQRQLGAKMIRLGELTQSHNKLRDIGAISDEIGRKLFFGGIEEIIWEYDGADLVSLPSSETNSASVTEPNLPTSAIEPESQVEDNLNLTESEKWASITEDDSEPTVIQNNFIPNESEELVLDTAAEFPFVPEDDSEPTVIQNNFIPHEPEELALDRAEEFAFLEEDDSEPTVIQNNFIPHEPEELALDREAEFPFVPEDDSEPTVIQNPVVSDQSTGLPLNTEEFPLEIENDSESPWEEPELISAIPELPLEEQKQQSQESEFLSDSALGEAIEEIFAEPPDIQPHGAEELGDLPELDESLEEPIGEKPDISPFPTPSLTPDPSPSARPPKNLESSELLESWFELGLKQASLGDLEKAIASWDKVLEFNPELAEVWHNRGSALGRMGKYEESVISFDRALEIEPSHYQAWNDRAHALYLMEKWQEAVDSWNKAISIMPNNHQFWYNRGCALEKLNLLEEAITSHEKALEIQPDFEPARSKYLSLLTDT